MQAATTKERVNDGRVDREVLPRVFRDRPRRDREGKVELAQEDRKGAGGPAIIAVSAHIPLCVSPCASPHPCVVLLA
jgi:hypothetical protein